MSKNKKEGKKNKEFKGCILNLIFTGLVFIIPVFFFWYAGYVTISAYTAHLWSFGSTNLTETTKVMLNLFSSFVIEYFLYLIYMLINYILFKKKCSNALLIINTIILSLFSFNKLVFAPVIIIIITIIELVLYFRKKLDYLLYFNLVLAVINLVIYAVIFIMNFYVDSDYIIFVFASLVGIYWAISLKYNNKLS